MWWSRGGELLRFGWFVLSFGGVHGRLHRVEPALCALPPSSPEDTKLRHPPQRGPAFTGSDFFSSLVGLLLGALLVGYGARAYLGWGRAAGSGRGWWAPALGPGGRPPRPGSAAAIGGDPGGEPNHRPKLGRIRPQWPLPAYYVWGCICCSGSACN